MGNSRNYTLMGLASIFWGASFVFIKITYRYIGPVTMIFSRLLIATTLLLVIDRLVFKSKIEKKDFKIFFLLGFTEPFLYFIGEGNGIKYVTPTQASVIIATIPLFTMIGSAIIFRERVTLREALGIVTSFIGIAVMVGFNSLLDGGTLKGIGLMFLAVIAAVSNALILSRLGNKYSSFTILTYQNLVGGLLFLPMFFIMEFNTLTVGVLNRELVLSILFLAIFPSVISFLFYISTMKRIGVVKTSAFTNLIPIVTGLISFLFLGEVFMVREVIGIAVVILGLFISQDRKKAVLVEY